MASDKTNIFIKIIKSLCQLIIVILSSLSKILNVFDSDDNLHNPLAAHRNTFKHNKNDKTKQ